MPPSSDSKTQLRQGYAGSSNILGALPQTEFQGACRVPETLAGLPKATVDGQNPAPVGFRWFTLGVCKVSSIPTGAKWTSSIHTMWCFHAAGAISQSPSLQILVDYVQPASCAKRPETSDVCLICFRSPVKYPRPRYPHKLASRVDGPKKVQTISPNS